jgi:hypothetical protein
MKKTIKKSLAALMAVLMIATVAPISAYAETLSVSTDTGLTTDNYSFKLATSAGNDYVINELKYVPKDKTINITEGTKSVSFDMEVVDFSWGNNATTKSNYSICNDLVWTCTSSDTNVAGVVTGFGAGKTNDGAYGYSYSTDISTNFSIDTSSFEAGKDYTYTITYKYQLKKYGRSGMSYGWSTSHQLQNTFDVKISVAENAVVDNTTVAYGSNIRVGDTAGLRFCFNTTADVKDSSAVTDFGFVYAASNVSNFEIGADGVYQVHATASRYNAETGITDFNLVFTEVPSTRYDMVIYARSYVITADGAVHYSDVVGKSFNDVAQQVLADGSIDEATKDAVNKLLGN